LSSPNGRPQTFAALLRIIIKSTLPGGSPSLVLLVSPRIEDHVSLQGIFHGSRWKMEGATTACDGLAMIRRNPCEIPVVICEHRLPDGDWKLFLAELLVLAIRPSLIVCSRLADERLWVEVLNHGGFDLLLSTPFVPEEVLRVVESAWSAWNSAARLGALPRKAPGVASGQAHMGSRSLAVGS
jgi:DNA-binding NtrC family response regulator